MVVILNEIPCFHPVFSSKTPLTLIQYHSIDLNDLYARLGYKIDLNGR